MTHNSAPVGDPRDHLALFDGATHPVDEIGKPGSMFVYGLQHVMSMYAGVVAVPLIVGSALELPFADLSYLLAATLLISGLATLLQTLGVPWVGAKLPIVQGTSFAAVGSMIAIGAGAGGGTAGLQAIFGAIVVPGGCGYLPLSITETEGAMRVQRLVMPGSGVESWTLLGDDHLQVDPVERFLAYLGAIERSPNTVKAYAHDLKDWFVFLGGRGVDWAAVTLEDVAAFAGWLRLPPAGRAGQVAVLPSAETYCSAASVNRKLAALTSFC